MANKIFEISDEEFIALIKENTCIKGVLFCLGYTTVGNSWGYTQIRERMNLLGLTAADFKGKSVSANKIQKTVSNEELFNTKKHQRIVVRRRIISENLIEYKCAICGIYMWNGKKLSLELDHINGINNDNRLENLRFLCPNCHSQTSTYGSKNRDLYVSDFDITDEVKQAVEDKYMQYRNIKNVAKQLGYKYKVVKEVVNQLGLSKPNQRFVIRYDKDMQEIARYPSISQVCIKLIENNEVNTKRYKTCRATFLRNIDKFWLNSYWKLMDA